MTTYILMLIVPIVLLPALKIFKMISDRMFVASFITFVFALYVEILISIPYVTIIFICSVILSNLTFKSRKHFGYAIILDNDATNQKIVVYDGNEIKCKNCYSEKKIHVGDIIKITKDN